MTKLEQMCREVARRLAEREHRVVFAESCTAGLVSASLAQVPGISAFLCGSAVTYRSETKAAWLGIKPATLRSPGPVSETVARQMARRVLARTPEAALAASVTGHLGPQAPTGLDGVIFIGLAERRRGGVRVAVRRWQLTARTRLARQREAAGRVLETVLSALSG